MTDVVISAIRPRDVAREVEDGLRDGVAHRFVLKAVADGGMLDRERLGAARYAAGLQAEVVLEAGAAAQRR